MNERAETHMPTTNMVKNNSIASSPSDLAPEVTSERFGLPELLESKRRALLVSEVATMLRISERQVYKLASERRIPSLRIGGCIRFDAAALASWLRQRAQIQSDRKALIADAQRHPAHDSSYERQTDFAEEAL